MYSRQTPFLSRIIYRKQINDASAALPVFHMVLDLKNSLLQYSPGDVVAILPENASLIVEKLLVLLKAAPTMPIYSPKTKKTTNIKNFLLRSCNLSTLSPALLRLFSLDPTTFPKENFDILTFFQQFPPRSIPIQECVTCLLPLLPRFYSIASAQNQNPSELHLLVKSVAYYQASGLQKGVGSDFLCHRAEVGRTPIPLYIQQSHHFALPKDPTTPIIMIGPGTGVAPYRGFLQQRITEKNFGNQWLFFGEKEKQKDFYYKKEWLHLQEKGHLKLSVAFSRDQQEKIYVQNRMWEERSELFSWLEDGAIVYVCGNAKYMAKEVESTLRDIINTEGNFSKEAGKAYFRLLRKSKRYRLDVY